MNIFRAFLTASFLATVTITGAGCGGDDDVITGEDKALSDLEITTGIDTLSVGSSIQFQAMATYADGSREDVTKDGVWNTSDAENATVDEDGMVKALDEGTVDITITYQGMEAEETFLVTP